MLWYALKTVNCFNLYAVVSQFHESNIEKKRRKRGKTYLILQSLIYT